MSTADDLKDHVQHVDYDIPSETSRLFHSGILDNPLLKQHLPKEASDCSKSISFSGSPLPTTPINWRFAESVAALKGYEATLVNVLLKRKYNVTPKSVTIDTDHAQLLFMSPMLGILDPGGRHISPLNADKDSKAFIDQYFPSWDKHRSAASIHRILATNIYPTKDDRHYHVHGSMNPDPTLECLGLPIDMEHACNNDGKKVFREAVAKHTAAEFDQIANNQYKQAGTTCWSTEEFKASEHGKANAHVGLFEIHHHPNTLQEPCWWPKSSSPQTSAARPLAGLKVVELSRVIAGPSVGRGLAELGASVMRVTAPQLTDMGGLHMDLNCGKWNCFLDLKKEEDRKSLKELIRESDVFLQGYRPHVLDKYGFSKEDVLKIVEDRRRGIIYARENCYGWQGPWADRTGWQQISDACCGVSLEFGRAMGHNEPVTPVFPNSDFCTGIAGVAGILTAILQRSEKGGSYVVDIAINYYSQWLVDSVGTYPKEVWEDVWTRNGRRVFRCDDNMPFLLPAYMGMLHANGRDTVLKPKFFEDVLQRNLGLKVRRVKPVLQYPGGEVQLGFNVGTRSNGVDQPRWPKDLSTEIVKSLESL